jgi:hypothetical protein
LRAGLAPPRELPGANARRPGILAEAGALPGLLLDRALGSALWRAGRRLDGKARLSEVADRLAARRRREAAAAGGRG